MTKPLAWVRIHPGTTDARLDELWEWVGIQSRNERWANDETAVAWLLAIATAIDDERTRRFERQTLLF